VRNELERMQKEAFFALYRTFGGQETEENYDGVSVKIIQTEIRTSALPNTSWKIYRSTLLFG
jgi:hypothetical protein